MGLFYSLDRTSWTPAASIGDGALASANNYEAYMCKAGNPGSVCRIVELFIQGETNTANFMPLAIRRHSTASVGPTAKTPGQPNQGSPANVGTWFQTVATTQPTISAGTHVFNCSIQAFGGLERTVTVTGAEWFLVGIQTSSTATGANELSLSMVSGTGQQMSTHMTAEEL